MVHQGTPKSEHVRVPLSNLCCFADVVLKYGTLCARPDARAPSRYPYKPRDALPLHPPAASRPFAGTPQAYCMAHTATGCEQGRRREHFGSVRWYAGCKEAGWAGDAGGPRACLANTQRTQLLGRRVQTEAGCSCSKDICVLSSCSVACDWGGWVGQRMWWNTWAGLWEAKGCSTRAAGPRGDRITTGGR